MIGGLTGINLGAVLGFSAILLPQLPSHISLEDKSWIASICNVGQLFGAFAAGFVSNKVGRKNCLLLFSIPLICGWLAIILDHENVTCVNIGRVLQGFGMMPSIGQVYLIEVLDTHRRESLGGILAICTSVGITLVYVLGAILHWMTVSWIFVGLIVFQCIWLYFLTPESPQWLMTQGLEKEAENALKKLQNQNVQQELLNLKSALKKNEDSKEVPFCSLFQEFCKPEAYKPLIFLIGLWIFQQFSGNYAVVFYAVDIFEGIEHDKMDEMESMMKAMKESYIAAITVGSIRIVGSILGAIFLQRKLSRRLLMTLSSIGMTMSMVSLAITEYFKHSVPDYTHLILVICSSSFILFHAIGFNVIPMLLVGELCPVRLKSWTSGITISIVAILVFTVVKVFPLAMATFGASITYGFFAVMCFLGTLYSFAFVPETRGKSVNELQDIYLE